MGPGGPWDLVQSMLLFTPSCSSMALIFLVEAVKSASAQQFWSAVDKWWHNMAAYLKNKEPLSLCGCKFTTIVFSTRKQGLACASQ